jgi:Fur family transcriptional regulator, zinc uptake regulator
MARPSTLPAPAEDLVLKELRRSKKPLGAYPILERVRKFGIKNSPVVYRALETLIKRGDVHRIKELNAFVACDCDPDHKHALSVLTVCGTCEKVEELHDHDVIRQLENLCSQGIMLQRNAVIEFPVICRKCAI